MAKYTDLALRLGCHDTGGNENWTGPCPVCGKPKNHFYINVSSGVAICHRCGERFGPKKLSGLVLQDSIIEKLGVSFNFQKQEELPDFVHRKLSGEVTRISDKALDAWLSATPINRLDENHIIKAVEKLGETHNIDLFKFRGLRVSQFGKYRDRILIPIYMDGSSKLPNSFTARSLFDRPPKYKVPSNTESLKKSACVLNTCMLNIPSASALSIPHSSELILVEGPMDAMSLGPHAVSMLGKRLSREQTRVISEMNPEQVTILLDSDTDIKDFVQVASELGGAIDGDITFAVLTEGDPASNPGGVERALSERKPFDSLLRFDLERRMNND